jgi:predicted metal-dependent hydrolase
MRKGRPDRDFLKGIIQGAAGMWHATQGNYKGAVSVLSRAVEYLEPYRPAKDGIDVERLSAALSAAVDACAAALDGGPPPRLAIEGTPVDGDRGLTLYNPAYDLL